MRKKPMPKLWKTPPLAGAYSHSMVLGGLLEMS